MTTYITDLDSARRAILRRVKRAKLIHTSKLFDSMGRYSEQTKRTALWSLLGDNTLHADAQWRIRPKRKTDWLIED